MRLPSFIYDPLIAWTRRYLMTHQCDVIIPSPTGAIYLKRWYVHPKSARRTDPLDTDYRTVEGNRFGVYIHRFFQSDEDCALHDHPRHNISIVLERGFWEHIKGKRIWRAPGSIVFRRATTPHRIELETMSVLPRFTHEALSIFITGPRIREWGFHFPKGWLDWRAFHSKKPDGTMRGCD